MKKSYESRLNAISQGLIILKKNESKYQHISVMVDAASSLDQKYTQIQEIIGKIGAIPPRTAANKQIAREELTAPCLKASSALKVYAYPKKDENLLSALFTNESDYPRLRTQQMLDYATFVKEQLTALGEELTPFGVSEALKSELEIELADYGALINEPRQLINERKTNNELIVNLLGEATELLNEQLDPMMELFIDDQEFYLAYKAARMIVDPATRKRVENETE